MKKSQFSEHQIITILNSVGAGQTAKDVCREHTLQPASPVFLFMYILSVYRYSSPRVVSVLPYPLCPALSCPVMACQAP